MSQVAIKAALETALKNVDGGVMPTAYENVPFQPPASDVPYQKVFCLFAEPDNPTVGSSHHREQGIFQVMLLYPLQQGTGAVTARAEQLRNVFKRGAVFTKDGISVIIERTPEIPQGMPDGDRWAVPVKVRFYSDITD